MSSTHVTSKKTTASITDKVIILHSIVLHEGDLENLELSITEINSNTITPITFGKTALKNATNGSIFPVSKKSAFGVIQIPNATGYEFSVKNINGSNTPFRIEFQYN